MQAILLMVVLGAAGACSPTTDITRTSTEWTAGRAPYEVVDRQRTSDSLRLEVKVASRGAARVIAEDVAVRTRQPFQRVEVDVFGLDDNLKGSPFAVLKWSTENGFVWESR